MRAPRDHPPRLLRADDAPPRRPLPGLRNRRGRRLELTLPAFPRPAAGTPPPGPARTAPAGAVPCLLVALAFGTFLLYLPVVRHQFVNFDDPDYVLENAAVRGGLSGRGARWAFSATHAGNWHPLTWLSLMLDVTLFGVRPGSLLLVNASLHAAATALLFLALSRMTGAVWRSAAVAALFSVHPLHVESVAWVSERKDVLSATFWMLSLLAYLGWARRGGAARYALLLGLFTAGLAAKPMLVTLPLVLVILDLWPLGRVRAGAAGGLTSALLRSLAEKAPLLALSLASSVVTFLVQRHASLVRSVDELPFPNRLGNALLGYVWYVGKAVWPAGLASFYPYPAAVDPLKPAGAALALAAATAGAAALSRRRPYALAGWLWYLVTLVPVIGLVQVGLQATADRYSYLPLVGLFIAVVWGAHEAARTSRPARAALGAVSGALILALAFATRMQLGFWRDSVTLHTRVNAVTGGHAITYTKLGAALVAQRRYREAADAYLAAVRLDPRYAPARYNLAMLRLSTGDPEAARAELRVLEELDPTLAAQVSRFLDYAARGAGPPGRP